MIQPCSPAKLQLVTDDVLIAEDDADVREVIAGALAEVGLHAVEAANGAEALAWLRHHSPRFLVLDLAMPILDGAGVMHELERQQRLDQIPVVVTAGRAEADADLPASRVVAYLQKPLDYEELLGVLRFVSDVTQESETPMTTAE